MSISAELQSFFFFFLPQKVIWCFFGVFCFFRNDVWFYAFFVHFPRSTYFLSFYKDVMKNIDKNLDWATLEKAKPQKIILLRLFLLWVWFFIYFSNTICTKTSTFLNLLSFMYLKTSLVLLLCIYYLEKIA